MNQEKIGKLIAECRREKKLTQVELAKLLGVTDKSVSKWENGKCLPDVSLYKELCSILGITLNEFFAGEKIPDENYKKRADENLFSALENSVFTIKDKVDYFKRKWERDHLMELIFTMLLIVFFIIFGFIKDNGLQYLSMAVGFIYGLWENNRKMAYIESHVYGKKSDITIEEFRKSINCFIETKEILKQFKTKEEAINYLVKETNISKKECLEAYEIIMKLDLDKIK